MDSNRHEIILVLDRSGSMATIRTDMIGAVNTFLQSQKGGPGKCYASACQFDDVYEPLFSETPIEKVAELTLETYVPRGSTALLDAVGRTIDESGERFAKMPEEERPSRVFFVIVTDGHENASKTFTREQIFNKVKTQREDYKWDFVFLGVGIDAFDAAAQMNMPMSSASPVIPDSANIAAMKIATADAVFTARTSGNRVSYTSAQRASMTTPSTTSPKPFDHKNPPPMPPLTSQTREKKWEPIR